MRGPQPLNLFGAGAVDWTSALAKSGIDLSALSALGVGTTSPSRLQEQISFGPNPGDLRMFAYRPASLPAGAPLVVALHGCGQSAAAYDRGVGWSTLADRLGFAVLAPEQVRANNAQGCFNWFQPEDVMRDRGEAASIRQMVRHLASTWSLDPTRIFVTGLSAGGAMTSTMLAAYPEVFAGGAVIAGLPYGAAADVRQALGAMHRAPVRSPRAWGDLVRVASPHRGPWPRVSVWHGDADMTVSIANAEAILAQWADVQGLDPGPSRQDRVDGHMRRVWLDARGQPAMESYTLAGLAHGAPIRAGDGPGDAGAAGAFILEAGVSSSFRIAQFWGLAPLETQAARPSAPAAPAGVQAVIASALRAAGLRAR